MPVKLINEAEEPEVVETNDTTDPLVTESGDLTLEARAASDFLTHADFRSVFEHPEAAQHVVTVGPAEAVAAEASAVAEKYSDMKHAGKGMKKKGKKGEKEGGMDYAESTLFADADLGEGVALHHGEKCVGLQGLGSLPVEEADADNDVPAELDNLAEGAVLQFLDGSVASQLVDESDLVDMFAHYCDELAEAQQDEDATPSLSDKAQLAALADLFGIEEKGPFKRGSFKKMAKKPVGKAQVARMLGAMLQKGVIKRAKKAGGGHAGGDYQKDSGYKTGGKKAKKAAVDRFKKKNKASRKKAALKAKTKLKDDINADEVPVFGLGVAVDESLFEVGTDADAKLKVESEKTTDGDESSKDVTEGEAQVTPDDVVRVVNSAGSLRSGAQLVAEATRKPAQAKTKSKAGKVEESSEEGSKGKPAAKPEGEKLSEGARLAAGMSGLNG